MQATIHGPRSAVVFGNSMPRPPPASLFGNKILDAAATGVKLSCAAGYVSYNHFETNSFKLVPKESADLELAFPEKGAAGPWNAVPGTHPDTSVLSVSVLVGQLDGFAYSTPHPLEVLTGPMEIKRAIRYALNCHEDQLSPPGNLTESHIIKAVCLTSPDVDGASPVAQYAFRIPQAYDYVSKFAMQLTLHHVVYQSGVSEFFVTATEFRRCSTAVVRQQAGPECIIHANQIAVSAEIVRR